MLVPMLLHGISLNVYAVTQELGVKSAAGRWAVSLWGGYPAVCSEWLFGASVGLLAGWLFFTFDCGVSDTGHSYAGDFK